MSRDLYVGAANGNGILRFDGTTGASKGLFTSGGQPDGGYSCPLFGPQGDLFVKEWSYGGSVWRFDASTGSYKATVVQNTQSASSAIALGPDGNLYVAGPFAREGSIDRYDPLTGQFMGTFVPVGSGNLAGPEGLRFGPDGNLYVRNTNFITNTFNVLRYANSTGNFLGEFVKSGSGGLGGGGDILFGPDGKLYASDGNHNAILRYDGHTGNFIDTFASGGQLKGPFGLAFGPDQNLYVANGGTNSVLRFDHKSGAFIDTFASPTQPVPTFITFGPQLQIITPHIPRYDIYDPWWWIVTHGGLVPPGPPPPWLQQFATAALLANAADRVAPELRLGVLETALRQIQHAAGTIERQIGRPRDA